MLTLHPTLTTGVANRLSATSQGEVCVLYHEKISHCGHVIEPGSVIMYDDEHQSASVGEVDLVIEVEGCFVLQHRVYKSGIVDFEKWGVHQKAVVKSSVRTHDIEFIELNTKNLAFITCFTFEDFGILII